MEEFLLNPFYLEDSHLKTYPSGGMISMEEFFLKLGLMTQKNHTELIQIVDELRVSMEALTKEVAKLNLQVVELRIDLSNKIAVLADASKNLSAQVTESFSKVEAVQNHSDKNITYLKRKMITHHVEFVEKFLALTATTNSKQSVIEEKLSTLASQTTNDNRAVKKSLENVEELLRLTVANQIMNLVDKKND